MFVPTISTNRYDTNATQRYAVLRYPIKTIPKPINNIRWLMMCRMRMLLLKTDLGSADIKSPGIYDCEKYLVK